MGLFLNGIWSVRGERSPQQLFAVGERGGLMSDDKTLEGSLVLKHDTSAGPVCFPLNSQNRGGQKGKVRFLHRQTPRVVSAGELASVSRVVNPCIYHVGPAGAVHVPPLLRKFPPGRGASGSGHNLRTLPAPQVRSCPWVR